MQRRVTALIALVALAALAGAAATLDAPHRPAVGVGSTAEATGSGGAPSASSGSGSSGDGGPDGQIDGGSPPPTVTSPPVGAAYVLAVLVGIVAVFAVLAFALTGDDSVAPLETDATRSTRPREYTVDPTYRDTGDNPVYAAWERLAELAGDPTASPREVADRAISTGKPSGAVEELTTVFRAVRYGRESADGDSRRRAQRAVDRLEDGDSQ